MRGFGFFEGGFCEGILVFLRENFWFLCGDLGGNSGFFGRCLGFVRGFGGNLDFFEGDFCFL